MSGTFFTEKELEGPGRRQMNGGNFGQQGMYKECWSSGISMEHGPLRQTKCVQILVENYIIAPEFIFFLQLLSDPGS